MTSILKLHSFVEQLRTP